jgi:hypothetical protein
MLRHRRLARKIAARPARAGSDMALASTIVFFGVLPGVLAAGFVIVQVVAAFGR